MKDKKNYIVLTLLALSTGLIWRLEVEWHGWTGLIWLSYFHYAIPISFFLVLSWINFELKNLTLKKRILLNISSILYIILIYSMLTLSIYYTMIPGPKGMMIHFNTSRWIIHLLTYTPIIIIVGFPIGVYYILRLFSLKSNISHLIASMILFLGSFPISIFLLDILNHKGSANIIHAIKSGFIFPLIVFSIGLLILGIEKRKL